MKLSELLRPIEHLRGSGPWTGRCPAHQDKTASLSITVGESGHLVLNCFADCSFGSIVQAMGFEQRDFFDIEVDLDNVSTSARGASALPDISELTDLKNYVERKMESYPDSPARDYVESNYDIDLDLAVQLKLGFDDGSDRWRRLSTDRYYDQPRLVVPMMTADGVIVAMQARRLGDGETPKWCGPSNPSVNTAWATTAIWLSEDDDADLIIPEGQGDYLTAVASGCSTISVRGASLAGNQRVQDTILAHGEGRRILVAGDNDRSGHKFNEKIARFCTDNDLQAHILDIERGGDLTEWRQLAGDNWAKEFATARRNAALANELADHPWLNMLMTDDHNGRQLMIYVGDDYVFCPALGWLHYKNGSFRQDRLDSLTTHVCQMLDDMIDLGSQATVAGDEDDDPVLEASGRRLYAHAHRSLNLPKRDNVKRAAQSKNAVDFAKLDTHRDLIVASNCVVNLRDGSTFDHDRRLLMTSGLDVAFDPDAKAERWLQFIYEITLGRPELADFLQRLIGYGITGRTDEQIVVQLWGRGSNGKSVFLNALRHVFEPIVAVAAFSTFEKKSGNAGSSDIAELAGSRLAIATEGERQHPIQEAVLKRVTGSDPLSAAHKYRDHFVFIPQFLLLLATNYRLAISGQDHGVWRRMVSVPFDAHFEGSNRDIFIEDKLRNEASGILTWAVRGAEAWFEQGLSTPQIILDAVQEHRDSSDALLGFIPEVVSSYTFDPSSTPPTPTSTPPETVSGTAVYQSYLDWCAHEMVKPMSKRALFEAICERLPDVEKVRRNSGMHFVNLELNRRSVGVQQLSRDLLNEK